MNKFITKQGSRIAAFAVGLVLFSTAAEAQNLVVGPTGTFNNQGTVKFRSNNGNFQNDAPIGNITNDGQILILGNAQTFNGANTLTSSAALRLPGKVSYARDTAASPQRVHNGFYANLDVKGQSVKEFTHNAGPNTLSYFIASNYDIAGGNRTYTGSTVTYDGGVAPYVAAQSVAGENLTNGTGYNNLAFTNPALKTLSVGVALVNGTTDIAATTVGGGFVVDGTLLGALDAKGNFTQAAGAGDFSLLNAGTATLSGTANAIAANAIVDNGTLTLETTTTTTVTGQLNLVSATGDLAVNGTGILNVNGAFANGDLTRTNQTFAATSTVEYQDGATTGIITTASTNPYGTLKLNRTAADIQANGTAVGGVPDINVATAIQLAGGFDLDMIGTTDGYVNLQNSSVGDVVYAGLEEVIGKFRRTHAFVTGTDYVYGNSATSVNFATAPSTGTFFQVNMDKDGQTQQYDPTRDIKRDVNIAYDNTGFTSTVKVGYTQTDRTEATWTAGYTEDQIRFLEGKADGSDIERVGTGQAYTRVASGATFGSVALPGITYTAADVDAIGDAGFFASNELILRAGPGIVASINPGRWSNPATWDAGEQPLAFDSVLVRHNVWAGFTRNVDNFSGDELHPTELAAAINIISPDGTYPTPTLLVGSSDITVPFETSTPGPNGTGSVLIGALGAATPNIPALADEIGLADVATNYIGGLLVFGDANSSNAFVPELFVKGSVINNGPMNVGGILSIGQ